MKKTRKEDFKTTDEIHDLTFVNRRCAHKATLAVRYLLLVCIRTGTWEPRWAHGGQETSRYLHSVVWCCGTFATSQICGALRHCAKHSARQVPPIS